MRNLASEIKADFCDTTGAWENAYSRQHPLDGQKRRHGADGRAFERCIGAVKALDHLAIEGGQ